MATITKEEFFDLDLGEVEQLLNNDLTIEEATIIDNLFNNEEISDNVFMLRVYAIYLNCGIRVGKII